jgi:carboxypeptidase T
VRLSDNPTVDEDEPEVLYTGMHHAREPIGMQLLIFYMYYLLENYDTDPDVQYIVDNFELYFIPILNPDGYAYNIQNDPNGGGGTGGRTAGRMMTGPMALISTGTIGYMWGYDNNGSSPVPSDMTLTAGRHLFRKPKISLSP